MTREWFHGIAENSSLLFAPILAGYVSGRATMYAIHSMFGLGDIALLRMAGCVVGTCIGVWLFFVIEGGVNARRLRHGRLRFGHSTAWGRKYL